MLRRVQPTVEFRSKCILILNDEIEYHVIDDSFLGRIRTVIELSSK